LSSHLAPFAFVERLLEAEEPIWYRWDKDVPALLRQLVAVANREAFWVPNERGYRGWPVRRRKARTFWLLDRLTESTDRGIFEPFLDTSGYASLGHGRALHVIQALPCRAEPLSRKVLDNECGHVPLPVAS
jgi:hypothetical protein